MSKTIWIVNKYAMPPQYEPRLQTIKMAHYLVEAGYEVIVFGSSIMHNMDMNIINDNSFYIEKYYNDLHFIHINTCSYKSTAGLKRVWSDVQFHYRLVKLSSKFKKPNIILATTSPIITNPLLKYARKNKIKYITQSLDIWPDDFANFGLISKRNPIMKMLFLQALYNYKESDACVFSWCGCYNYMKEKKWDKSSGGPIDLNKLHYINNGVDLSDFDAFKKQYIIEDKDLNNPNYKKIIYIGSIRLANKVEDLIKAAEKLKERKDVKFLIYGNGDDRETLIEYCKKNELNNICFKDKWVDPKYVPYIVSSAYINVANYISSDFAKYGISSSKMFQYMAAGKPIICNINIFECPITKNNIGIAKEFKNADEYAQAIESLINLSKNEYTEMCIRARETAKEFDYKYLTDKLIKVIERI